MWALQKPAEHGPPKGAAPTLIFKPFGKIRRGRCPQRPSGPAATSPFLPPHKPHRICFQTKYPPPPAQYRRVGVREGRTGKTVPVSVNLLKPETALLQGAKVLQVSIMAVKDAQVIGVYGVKGHDAVFFSHPESMDLRARLGFFGRHCCQLFHVSDPCLVQRGMPVRHAGDLSQGPPRQAP